jgi:hypothetical protein
MLGTDGTHNYAGKCPWITYTGQYTDKETGT